MEEEKRKRKRLNEILQPVGYAFIIILAIFTAAVSVRSVKSVQRASNALAYAGFIGTYSQNVAKGEIYGRSQDTVIGLVDEMLRVLSKEENDEQILRIDDRQYQTYMKDIERKWKQMKEEIEVVRAGGDTDKLYTISEDINEENHMAVFAAQAYIDTYVKRIRLQLGGTYGVFFVFIGAMFLMGQRNRLLERRADKYKSIAYYDPYTGIYNRSAGERELNRYRKNPYEGLITVFVFDLNNLKLTNDEYGHQEGDKLITSFAKIADVTARSYGFICRYGGDEFIAIFKDCEKNKAERFVAQLKKNVSIYNDRCKNPWQKISFSYGYSVAKGNFTTIDDIMKRADEEMYERKMAMKKNAKGKDASAGADDRSLFVQPEESTDNKG
ncbi:MAG: GGDEF domain-containing protein [Lachnospiraceae bacterium]|nr:GGDEF domain-containing protein [Lachnospiraceae bacterium]